MCVGQRRHDKTSCDVISVRLEPALLPLPAMEVAASLPNPVSWMPFTFIELVVSHKEGRLVLIVRGKKKVCYVIWVEWLFLCAAHFCEVGD